MNKEKLEKDWTGRGFSFGVGTIKAGDGVNEAVHENQDELVVMERGKYEFTVDNETFIQEGDSEVLIPAGSTHSIKNLGTKDSKIYYGYKLIN
jgi:mannose-6-phosphate isomerase-like protein (cupin superfamily)